MQLFAKFPPRSRWSALLLGIVMLWGLAWSVGAFALATAQAQQQLPDVRYSTTSNTIYIGRPYSATLPAEAPYVGYPSHPAAPKLAITIPQLASIMQARKQTNLLIDQGNGIWLVKVNLVVYQNTRLEITNANATVPITQLRLESYPTGTNQKKFTKVVADGGQILLQGIKVYAWNTLANAIDPGYLYGRSYLAALNGARMDLWDTEASYLGWQETNPNFPNSKIGKGEPSGLAWRLRATPGDMKTGSTGSIKNSLIHHNYYGNYTYQTINMVFTNNKVYSNVYYGFDPHDYSSNMEIANNEFYNNGYHGLILSRGCVNNAIHDNKMYNNGGHGFMLDRGSDRNQVYNNELYGNSEDGITVFESSNNVFTNNNIHHNKRHGLRINAAYDSTDSFDGLAIDNIVNGNTLLGNAAYGINLYDRADRTVLTNNTVTNNGSYGIYLRTGGNRLENNVITGNTKDGVYILGGPPYTATVGVTPILPAVDRPGHANWIAQNTIQRNKMNGISLVTQATDTTATGNTISSNSYNGVYIQGSLSMRNWVSQNSITSNTKIGISLNSSANNSLAKPVIKNVVGKVVSGTAKAGAKVEVYRDTVDEGKTYKGVTTANASGVWSLTLPPNDSATEGPLTAIAIDSVHNTSPFSSPKATVVAAEIEEAYVTDAMITQQLADDAAAAAEDMQVPDDVDYSETLQELAEQEANAPSVRLFLPLITQ